MVAEPALLQEPVRDRRRLGRRDGQVLDQPLPLAQDVVRAVAGVGQAIGQHLQQHRQSGRQHRTGDHQPLRVDRGVQVPADQRQVGVDLLADRASRCPSSIVATSISARALCSRVVPANGTRSRTSTSGLRGLRTATTVRPLSSVGPGERRRPGAGGQRHRRHRPRPDRGAADLLGASGGPSARLGDGMPDDAQHGAATGIQRPGGVGDLVGGDRGQQVRAAR